MTTLRQLISFELAINSFQVTIDLELKIRYSSCRKGNISVVDKHSRSAHIQTILTEEEEDQLLALDVRHMRSCLWGLFVKKVLDLYAFEVDSD